MRPTVRSRLCPGWHRAGRLAAIGVALLCIGAMGAGCSRLRPPQNAQLELYGPEKDGPGKPPLPIAGGRSLKDLSFSSSMCAPAGSATFLLPASHGGSVRGRRRLPPMRYSPGDRFNLMVFEAPEFNGDYAVNADGRVILPFASQIEAVGLTNDQLSGRIEHALVTAGLFPRGALRLSVRPVLYAPINITVSGAVFHPGRHVINVIRDSDKLEKMLAKYGDSPIGRLVPEALMAAGGIRPDADISSIRVTRDGKTFRLDWRGAITGGPVNDMPLVDGDHVEVPESGCFQSALVRPSQITTIAIRLFSSNLTAPSRSASASLNNTQFTKEVPYGTRLLQGLVNANCVGGSLATNAHRYAVLISRNPKTGETEVIQRSIEELVRSADRDTINPYLMPSDAIACYDSKVTEMQDIAGVISSLLAPATAIKTLMASPTN